MIHLSRSQPLRAEADALAAAAGERLGLGGLVDALVADAPGTGVRQGRHAWVPRLLGRAVDRAFTWERADRGDRRWWPQGITSSSDGGGSTSATDRSRGRDLLVTSWYSKKPDGVTHGSRISVIDLETLRYAHVLLVVPSIVDGELRLEPLRVHAGGLVWHGPWLHVAATGRGFMTCHWDDLVRIDGDPTAPLEVRADGISAWGHTYLLPVRLTHRGSSASDAVAKLRFSFLSLDRTGDLPRLVAGEYGRGQQSRRITRFTLDGPGGLPTVDGTGRAVPLHLDDTGIARMQGAVVAREQWYATVSMGPWTSGSVYVGTPGRLRGHRFATPMGPEDLAYWPEQDRLWTATEHPWRRWVCGIRRSWFDAR